MSESEQSIQVGSMTSSQRLMVDIERNSVKIMPGDTTDEALRKLALGVNNNTVISLKAQRGVEHAISENAQTQKTVREHAEVIGSLVDRNKTMDHYLKIISECAITVKDKFIWWMGWIFKILALGVAWLIADFLFRHYLHTPLPTSITTTP